MLHCCFNFHIVVYQCLALLGAEQDLILLGYACDWAGTILPIRLLFLIFVVVLGSLTVLH